MIDRKAIFVDFLLKKGFKIKNPDKYVVEQEMQPPAEGAMPEMPGMPPQEPPMPQPQQQPPMPGGEPMGPAGLGANIPDLTP